LELPAGVPAEVLTERLHGALRALDADYRSLEDLFGYRPLRLVALPPGTLRGLQGGRGGDLSWDAGLGSRVNPPARLLAKLTAAAAREEG
ncbi:MAG TPA: hypothetical protein GX511_00830, partial [Firmicutes bacterium]|nr:hypothetical protein [Bacillota bacterium]